MESATVKLKAHILIALARVGVLTIVIGIWELLGKHISSFEFALARPSTIWSALVELCIDGGILRHIWATGIAAFCGMVAGTLIGASLGLMTWFSRAVAMILRPFIVALGALPVLAIAPLMIIWFGVDLKMKVALAILSTVFVSFAQSARGAERVSRTYVDVLKGMNASRTQIFTKVVIPGSLDWVFSSMRLNAGLALLGTFIGEFIASDRGLGYLVLRASSLYDVPRALAASLFIVALAVLFDLLGTKAEQHRNAIIRLSCISRLTWSVK